MVFMRCFTAIALLFAGSVFAVHVNHVELEVTNKVIAPDGFERSAIVVNGIFPGPLIQADKNDHMEIILKNRMTDPTMRRSTSIHWHGFFQARTSGMDGPSFVNQCPIGPGDTFPYEFGLNGQSGSYWYHSHLSTQYCDGLRGTIISYDANDPLKHLYDIDDATTVITLADWYHDVAPDAQKVFFQSGTVPIPDSGLINGVGRYNGGPLVPYAVVNVKRGLRYRFRLMQIACRPFFTFSIDGHNLSVIELDGTEHDPVTVQNVDIYAAQRVSVVVTANQTVGNYWIRAPPTGGSSVTNPNFNPNLTLAILRYAGAPKVEPVTVNVPGLKHNDADSHPIASAGPGKLGTGPPDVALTLNIAQPNPPFFDINGVSYISPTVPVLLQILSGAKRPSDFFFSENVNVLPPNSLVEISIPGTGAHPFHLHGHAFDIVRVSNSNTTDLIHPPRRDVVPVNGGNLTFRFFTDNPGAWFLHCHIDWHLEAGLAIVFGESPDLNIGKGNQTQIVTEDWSKLCPDYDELAPEFQ